MINYNIALKDFEIYIMILMRLATFIFAAPFFNTANTPQKLKVGFAFVMAMLVYQLGPQVAYEYTGVLDFTTIVIKECIVGLLLGAMTSFCVQIIMFAGRMIDLDIGLAMASLFDPTTKAQVGIMGNMYYYTLMLLLIVSGLHRFLVTAIIDTYNVIPIGGVKFNPSLYDTVIGFMSDYFVIGFRIALPVFATILLLNCILAILARIAPQMNMFVVGMQLKIFTGIAVIFVVIVMLSSVSNYIYIEIKDIMVSLVKGMS